MFLGQTGAIKLNNKQLTWTSWWENWFQHVVWPGPIEVLQGVHNFLYFFINKTKWEPACRSVPFWLCLGLQTSAYPRPALRLPPCNNKYSENRTIRLLCLHLGHILSRDTFQLIFLTTLSENMCARMFHVKGFVSCPPINARAEIWVKKKHTFIRVRTKKQRIQRLMFSLTTPI